MIAGFSFGLVIMVCMFLFVPESPRFYVAQNKHEKALKVYKYLAKMHPDQHVKKKIALLEEKVTNGLQLQEDASDELPFKDQMAYFIKTKTRVVQAIIISLCWFVNVL